MREAVSCGKIGKIFGMRHGIQGLLDGEVVDLRGALKNEGDFGPLRSTPAMALGSCRFKLPDCPGEAYPRILDFLRENDICCILYIGGNDSMDTVQKLSGYLSRQSAEDIRVVGIPKTIDNDLPGTDHTPGFGSAARFIAVTVSQIARDYDAVYDDRSGDHEPQRRLAYGGVRAGASDGHPRAVPDLPAGAALFARVFPRFLGDIARAGQKTRVVVVSEGLLLPNGRYVANSEQSGRADVFGYRYLAGIGSYPEELVREKFPYSVRSVNLNVLQRCAAHLASENDLNEAEEAGAAAVRLALSGRIGVMVSIERVSTEPYRVRYGCCGVEKAANQAKTVPADWIAPSGCDVTEQLVRYLRPLIGSGAAEYFELEKAVR